MDYIKAEDILPQELIEQIQQYVDGRSVYIPRRATHRQAWGDKTLYRLELAARNAHIRLMHRQGSSVKNLSMQYHLSEKTIRRILRKEDVHMPYTLIRLTDHPQWKEPAAAWFHEKWGIPLDAYLQSMDDALTGNASVPQWYLALEEDRIVGGMGVIENDFHNRPDLTPNVCAVYTEPERRGLGIAGTLLHFVCDDMRTQGIDTLYLVTSHTGFYERYGWRYFCPVYCDGEDTPSRMYIHE